MAQNNWFARNISKRSLIKKNEDKITYLQIIGFSLIGIGINYMIICGLVQVTSSGEGMAISFFIIMLGMAFAFPSLLQGGDKEMSTMRIAVFMVVNVICILLIKIGWNNEIKSLKAIDLDEYWMGVIAFIFGAKATQSFFESRMANQKKDNISDTTATEAKIDNLPLADVNVITEAVKEKGEEWVASFPYVTGFSVRNKIIGSKETNCVALIFKVTQKPDKLDYGRIPEYIPYRSKDGKIYKIPTDVVLEKMPEASVMIRKDEEPFPLGNSISRRNNFSTGSIGLVVNKDEDITTNYIVSCYHVFCDPELAVNNKTFSLDDKPAPLSSASREDHGTNHIGDVVFGKMDTNHDFAVAKVKDGIKLKTAIELDSGPIIPKSFGRVIEGDKLTLCGRSSGISQGIVKSTSAPQTINYVKGTISQFIQGLIEVEKFSTKGDSGGIVINSKNRIVGLLIADSDQFSYVLPVQNFITKNNYSLKTELT